MGVHVFEELLRLGVVAALDLVVVCKGLFGGDVAVDLEPVAVECVVGLLAGNVPDCDLVRLKGPLERLGAAGVARVRRRAVLVVLVILEGGCHVVLGDGALPCPLEDLGRGVGAGDEGGLYSCRGHAGGAGIVTGWRVLSYISDEMVLYLDRGRGLFHMVD